jgi:hypothetical protein
LNLVAIEWFCEHQDDEPARIGNLLVAMRDTIPDALPVTYQSAADEAEFRWEERFLFRDAAVLEGVMWQSRPPFAGGFTAGISSPGRPSRAPFVTISLDFDELALADEAFSERLPHWVGEVGTALGSFYAMGVVQENLVLRQGRPVATVDSKTRVPKVMDAQRWLGLPWSGVAFEWFGRPYLPYIPEEAHRSGQTAGDGLFVSYSSKEERLRVLPTTLLNARPEGAPASVTPPLRGA